MSEQGFCRHKVATRGVAGNRGVILSEAPARPGKNLRLSWGIQMLRFAQHDRKRLSRQAYRKLSIVVKAILLSVVSCSYEPEQPINFNHKAHFQYFVTGAHEKVNLKMHQDALGEIPEELERGECRDCHGSFEEAAEGIPTIKDCAGCHQVFLETDLRERPSVRPCVGCHRSAVQGHNASIPNIEICIACHRQAITEDPEEGKLMVYLKNDKRINWTRVNRNLTGDTHFSHERHVAASNVDCRECHGKVDQASMSLGVRMKINMETCMDCHEKMAASNDCLACHY